MKTLGQIAYEATTEGGKQNFGKWKNAPDVVRRVHEQMAQAVAKEMRHLHPGNEVKLKRENEWMRKWLRDLLTGKAGHFEMMAVIKPRIPDLFKAKRRGSK